MRKDKKEMQIVGWVKCINWANTRFARTEKGAFTLVELIVVITILAILGTIAFISLQGYSRDARDSVRITDLSNISKQLELMLVKAGQVYIPEKKVDITASGTVILYQGQMGQDTLNKLRVNNGGLDPVDQSSYIYSTTKNLKQYELMGFLENGNRVTGIFPQANAATNLTNRFPYVKGDSIGIILDPSTNEPLNLTGTGIDVINTNNIYKVYLDNSASGSISGTGSDLKYLEKPNGSCNAILKLGKSTGDGIYKINPTGKKIFDIYCDMTTDGGGWTLFAKNTTFAAVIGDEVCSNKIDLCNGSLKKYISLIYLSFEILALQENGNKSLSFTINDIQSNFAKILFGYNIGSYNMSDLNPIISNISHKGGKGIPTGKGLQFYWNGVNHLLVCGYPGGCGNGPIFSIGWGNYSGYSNLDWTVGFSFYNASSGGEVYFR